MKIPFVSNIFPNPIEPSLGCFNDSLVQAQASTHDVHVFSPSPARGSTGSRENSRTLILVIVRWIVGVYRQHFVAILGCAGRAGQKPAVRDQSHPKELSSYVRTRPSETTVRHS